ncbi:MAG: hypothetical protein U1F43_15040 [Myxococcota bacterium]
MRNIVLDSGSMDGQAAFGRSCGMMSLAAFLLSALLGAIFGPASPPDGGGGGTTPRVFRARTTLPCGASMLELSGSGAEREVVAPVGPSNPAALLRYDAFLGAELVVLGWRTGRFHEDEECGRVPELYVVAFAPSGKVHRVFCEACLEGALQVYNAARPSDRFVPEDFEAGPSAPLLDGERCAPRPPGGCRGAVVAQTGVGGVELCCPFLR